MPLAGVPSRSNATEVASTTTSPSTGPAATRRGRASTRRCVACGSTRRNAAVRWSGRPDPGRVLRHVPAQRGRQAVAAGIGAQHLDHPGDGVGRVVVHRSAREAEAAGDGERARRVGEPDLAHRDLHCRREARIEVEVCDVVDTDCRCLEHVGNGRTERGRTGQGVAFGDEPVVVRLGTRVQVHHAIVGDAGGAGGLVRAQQDRGALVDVDVRAHPLRVREHHHAVVGGHGADLARGVRGARPRVRVVCGDRGERRPELGDVLLVRVDAAPGLGAQRGLEQRVHQRRRDRTVAHLLVARSRPVVADHPRAGLVVAGLPLELDAGFAAGAPAGVHALGAPDEHDVALAALDAFGELVDEQLRAVATDRRDRGATRCDAEPAGEQRAGIRIAPRHDLHDCDDVGAREQRRARVGLGRPRRGLEQLDRRLCGFGRFALRRLADADDDRGAGIHGSRTLVVRVPLPRGPATTERLAPRCRDRSSGTDTSGTRPRR